MEEQFIKVDGKDLNYYEFLNISIDSSLTEIKRAYRKTSLKYHPDKNPDNPQAEELFRRLTKVYDVLSDTTARQAYDNYLITKLEKIKKRREMDRERKAKIQEFEREEEYARGKKDREREAEAKLKAELERLKKLSRPKEYYEFEVEEDLPQPNFNLEYKLKEDIERLKSQLTTQELSIGVKWETALNIDRYGLLSVFSKYGEIEDIIVSKHKSMSQALISFSTVLGTYNSMISKKRKDVELNNFQLRWLTKDQLTPSLVLNLVELLDKLAQIESSKSVKQSIGSNMSLDEYFSFTLTRIKKAKYGEDYKKPSTKA